MVTVFLNISESISTDSLCFIEQISLHQVTVRTAVELTELFLFLY